MAMPAAAPPLRYETLLLDGASPFRNLLVVVLELPPVVNVKPSPVVVLEDGMAARDACEGLQVVPDGIRRAQSGILMPEVDTLEGIPVGLYIDCVQLPTH